jgi:hypothetical protein
MIPVATAQPPTRKRSIKRIVLIAIGLVIAGKVGYDFLWGWNHAGELIRAASATQPVGNSSSGAPVPAQPSSTVRGADAYPAEIEVIRNGVLAGYTTTTVGKAFEGTFQNPGWSLVTTDKGATVVEFHGTVKPDVLEKAGLVVSNESSEEDLPVKFQFVLTADKTSFQLAFVEINALGNNPNSQRVLEFIYR